MPDAVGDDAPDLDLLLVPGDEAELVARCAWASTPRAGRPEPSLLYVVLHRGHGLWTHAYRVAANPRRPGRLLVHVLRVAEGDRRDELRAWLLAGQRRDGQG